MTDHRLRPEDVDLSTVLADAHLDNPVMTASGCAAAGRELQQFFDVSELGAVVTKSIMRDPRSGRPTPRMAETPSGMLNSIGLQGPGIDAFLARDLPWLLQHDARPDRVDRRLVAGGVRRARPPGRQHPGRRGDRGQHLVPERREPWPRLRL